MGAPGEPPVIAEYRSLPSLGVKPIIMNEQTASAFLDGVRAAGGDGELVPWASGLFRVKITRLADRETP